jgi:hypothetical protein
MPPPSGGGEFTYYIEGMALEKPGFPFRTFSAEMLWLLWTSRKQPWK